MSDTAKSKLKLRLSLALNIILVLAIACACVYKFTNVRYLLGGGQPHMKTTTGMPRMLSRLAS